MLIKIIGPWIAIVLFIYSACAISGRCYREEKMEKVTIMVLMCF